MPVKKYYKGHGEEVMKEMIAKKGKKAGEREFYATANKMRKGSPAERKAQPKAKKPKGKK